MLPPSLLLFEMRIPPLLGAFALVAGMLSWPTARASAQRSTGTIRGKVVTATGAPLANAQIGVVGATVGALSAKDGGYVITDAPAGAQTLRVRLIGYAPLTAPVTVPAGGSVTKDFTLTAAAAALDEVVVTGTAGAARRREVGNSIGTVKVSDTPQPTSDFGSLLAGKLSGVQITGGSGNVGAGKAIRLRGNTSMALSNEPLIYIDGVRIRGDAYPKNWPNTGTDQRSSNVNASPLNDILPDDIERIEVIKGAAATTLYGTDAAPGVVQIFTKRGSQGAARWQVNLTQGVNQLQKFGTNDAKLIFMDPFLRNGNISEAQVQVSGGTGNNVRYLLSASGNYTEGVLPNDLDRKQTLRANVDFTPAKNLTVNWNSSYTNDYLVNTPAGNNAHGITLNAFRRDRNYFASANPDTIRQVLAYQINSGIDRAIVGLTSTWTPLARFSSRVTFGMDRSAVENRNLRPFGFAAAPLGIISDQRWLSRTASVDWVNNYDQPLFGDRAKATFSFGTQYINANVSDNTAYSETFPGPSNPTVSSGSIKNAFENRQTVITGGGFAQSLIGVRDRYFLTLGLRVDGNSAFGKNFGLQPYPKVSGSWVASDESWWPSALGTTFKLRAAMGSAGRAPGAFDAVQTWNPVGWGGQPAFRPSNLGNPDLGPERSTEKEVGFDFSALSNRVTVDFTSFSARTTDALFRVNSAPSLGFLGSQLKNVGTLQKRGFEMTINGKLVDRTNFGVDASMAVTTNQSKVLSLGGAAPFQVGNTNAFAWVIEGQPAPVIRAKKINNPDALYTPGAPLDTTGGYLFGPAMPTRILNGSLAIRTWKGITVTLRGEYQGGAYMSENSSFQALSRTVLWPTCFRYYDKVAAKQPVTNYENATCVQTNTKEDMFIFKADFFKLRDATVTVPLRTLVPGTRNGLLVLTAQNAFRRNFGMPMFDPEQSGNDGYSATARYISEHIPAPAVFMASLRLSY